MNRNFLDYKEFILNENNVDELQCIVDNAEFELEQIQGKLYLINPFERRNNKYLLEIGARIAHSPRICNLKYTAILYLGNIHDTEQDNA